MSAGVVRWSTSSVVTTHDWGVLVQNERGAQRVRGTGLQRPVAWLRSRLAEPTTLENLLAPLPAARRAPVERLVEALTLRGAIRVLPVDPPPGGPVSVELLAGPHAFSRAAAEELCALWQLSGVEYGCSGPRARTRLPILDLAVGVSGSPGQVTGFRLMLWGDELWLGRFAGQEDERAAMAEQMTRHLVRSDPGGEPAGADPGGEPWFPWLAREVAQAGVRCGAEETGECVRLGTDPLVLHRHRLVREDDGPAVALAESAADEDPADPLVVSRRCAALVDSVMSPVAPPEESGLRQLPLQLSRCRVRVAEGVVETVVGHGWTLEQARGRAVGAAVLAHGLSRMEPLVRTQPFHDPDPDGTGARAVRVLPRERIKDALAGSRAAVSLGATAELGAVAAATRLAAHLEMIHGQRGLLTVAFPHSEQGADLLAIHQDCREMLLAPGLPFHLVAVEVGPGAVVTGVSATSEQEAVREVILQALLHHQSLADGNGAVAPRLYRTPPRVVPAPGDRPARTLSEVLRRHGSPLTVPLSNGPSFDAALPHKVLVVLDPGGV